MAKQLLALLAFLAVAGQAMAVEEIMPMHPGAPYNEVGIGIAVAPIRRATSEDAPARRQRPDRLHQNRVTLKIPAPTVANERRLRMVEAKVDTTDGTIDFDLDNATLLTRNAEIPGLVAPEYLAMDKYNLADAQPPRWPEEPTGGREAPLRDRLAFDQTEALATAREKEHFAPQPQTRPQAIIHDDVVGAKKPARFPSPPIPDLPDPAPASMPAKATSQHGAIKLPDAPEAAPKSIGAAVSSLRPPSDLANGGKSSVAPPPTAPSQSLKPPSMGIGYADDETIHSGLSIASAGAFDGDGTSTLSSTRMDMASITSLTRPEPEAIRHEPWGPNVLHIQNVETVGKPRRKSASLPEPDEYGLTPMRELRSVLGTIHPR